MWSDPISYRKASGNQAQVGTKKLNIQFTGELGSFVVEGTASN